MLRGRLSANIISSTTSRSTLRIPIPNAASGKLPSGNMRHKFDEVCACDSCDNRPRNSNKLLSLTYKVLTTTQPSYLHNLITVQPPRSTRSSSLVTLARPSTSSSLRITDRSFQYASSRLWNQLPAFLHQPRTNLSTFASSISLSGTSSISSINSPLSSSITPSLFHSRLKTFLFFKSFPP